MRQSEADILGMRFNIDRNYIIWPLVLIIIFLVMFFILRFGVAGLVFKEGIPIVQTKKTIDVPEIVKAIYLTSTSAGSNKKIDSVIELASESELNTVVIDIKDFSGYISYDSSVPEAEQYKTERIDIKDIDGLVKKLHENNIYVIGRMTVFQDPALVRARADWAVQNKYTHRPWQDHKGLSWLDPANRDVWNYLISIEKDALSRGFDEINLDYVRFPSDGNLDSMIFPARNESMTRPQVLREFYKYMRDELGDAKISADMFGFVTTRKDDFGVGQVMEDAFEYFDYISPMVYPSHYPSGFMGFANPAEHPYEVVYNALKMGTERLRSFKETTGNNRPRIRPWLQDFDLGADYNALMVKAQIKATQDALGDLYNGFMLWNSRNVYSEIVFNK